MDFEHDLMDETLPGFDEPLDGEARFPRSGRRRVVRRTQRALNTIQAAGLRVDGIYGSRTRAALKRFQRRFGLRVDGILGPRTRRRLSRALRASSLRTPSTRRPPAAGAVVLRRRIVEIALRENEYWRHGTTRERDPRVLARLRDYWRTGVRRRFSRQQLGNRQFQSHHPWSAAFISWVMRRAGAGAAFRYSAAHATYIVASKANRLAGSANPFKAYRVSERQPRPGDLVCRRRAGSGATYANIRRGMKTHCDIVVKVRPNSLIAIGGNVSNSVNRTRVRLDSRGFIRDRRYFAVIRIG